MIKKGTLCVFQNLDQPFLYLNGNDVIAQSGLRFIKGIGNSGSPVSILGYETDEIVLVPGRPWAQGRIAPAAHQLREKNPPPNEFLEEEETQLRKEMQYD